jgi:hypothetical protein
VAHGANCCWTRAVDSAMYRSPRGRVSGNATRVIRWATGVVGDVSRSIHTLKLKPRSVSWSLRIASLLLMVCLLHFTGKFVKQRDAHSDESVDRIFRTLSVQNALEGIDVDFLKIFVYDVPYSLTTEARIRHPHCANDTFGTEIFFHEALLASKVRTLNPEEAHLFYVPVYGALINVSPLHRQFAYVFSSCLPRVQKFWKIQTISRSREAFGRFCFEDVSLFQRKPRPKSRICLCSRLRWLFKLEQSSNWYLLSGAS